MTTYGVGGTLPAPSAIMCTRSRAGERTGKVLPVRLWILSLGVVGIMVVPLGNPALLAQQSSGETGEATYFYDLRNGSTGFIVRFTINMVVTPSGADPEPTLAIRATKRVGVEALEGRGGQQTLQAEHVDPVIGFALVSPSGSAASEYMQAQAAPISSAPAALESTRQIDKLNLEEVWQSNLRVPRDFLVAGMRIPFAVVALMGGPLGDPARHGQLSGDWPVVELPQEPAVPEPEAATSAYVRSLKERATTRAVDLKAGRHEKQPPLNREAAVAYAKKYTVEESYNLPKENRRYLYHNPDWHRYANDCTNFLSQSLLAGGWSERGNPTIIFGDYDRTSSWFHFRSHRGMHSATWVNANNFHLMLQETKWATPTRDWDDLSLADIVLVDHSNPSGKRRPDGVIDHAMMVTKIGDNGMPYFTYHSRDHVDKSLLTFVQDIGPDALYYPYIVP